jgi:hypothetical protein
MKNLQLKTPSEVKLRNIVDMGLSFAAMMRVFNEGSKTKLQNKIISEIENVFKVRTEQELKTIHANLCNWGMDNIKTAARKKDGKIVKPVGTASYGQIAKTLDVVFGVVIYYCHLPDSSRAQTISKWLYAAVDTKMMNFLKNKYRNDIKVWPTTIEQVDRHLYLAIQSTVRKHIELEHDGKITPIEFDDIYWEALNRD